MEISIQDWNETEDEARAVADLMAGCFPYMPAIPPAGSLAHFRLWLRNEGSFQILARGCEGMHGFAWLSHRPGGPRPSYGLIAVHPEYRHRGLGRRLLSDFLRRARALPPGAVRTRYRADCPEADHLLSGAGFTDWERLHGCRWSAARTLPDWALAKEAQLLAKGIEIVDMDGLRGLRSDWREAFYAHECEILPDIPTQQGPMPIPFDRWSEQVDQWGNDGQVGFFAIKGDRLLGSIRACPGAQNSLLIDLTGVSAEHRRKGLSTVLKLALMRHAIAHGRSGLRSQNHVGNPMFDLNLAFGFERVDDCRDVVLRLES